MQRQLTRPVTQVLLVGAVCGLAALQLPGQPATPPPPTRVVQFASVGGSYLGIGVQDVDTARSKELKLKEERGVEITLVDEDSPASRAGLRKGDVVLEMNGQRVEGLEQFVRMVREMPPGREAKLTVSRSGDLLTLTAKVGQRKSWTVPPGAMVIPAVPQPGMQPPAPRIAAPDVPRAYMSWRSGTLGVEAEALKGGLADYFGVKQGVLVRSVSKGTPAERAGLKAGDVIIRVNDKVVESPADVSMALRERGEKKTVNVVVMREKKEVTVSVTLDDEERGAVPPRVKFVRDVRNDQFF